jgi:hypothetical protein
VEYGALRLRARLRACFTQRRPAAGPLSARGCGTFRTQAVIIHKASLSSRSKGLPEAIDPLHMRIAVVTFFNCNDAIVAFRIFLIALLALNHADNSARELAACKSRLIHQHQHIERVAVTACVEGRKPKS